MAPRGIWLLKVRQKWWEWWQKREHRYQQRILRYVRSFIYLTFCMLEVCFFVCFMCQNNEAITECHRWCQKATKSILWGDTDCVFCHFGSASSAQRLDARLWWETDEPIHKYYSNYSNDMRKLPLFSLSCLWRRRFAILLQNGLKNGTRRWYWCTLRWAYQEVAIYIYVFWCVQCLNWDQELKGEGVKKKCGHNGRLKKIFQQHFCAPHTLTSL